MVGRFAVDFVTVRRDGRWEPYAIELNLRKGGTLQFLTDGTYATTIVCSSWLIRSIDFQSGTSFSWSSSNAVL